MLVKEGCVHIYLDHIPRNNAARAVLQQRVAVLQAEDTKRRLQVCYAMSVYINPFCDNPCAS